MNSEEYDKMYSFEKDYWWFVGKRKLIFDNLPSRGGKEKLLDIGCGTGIMDYELSKKGFNVFSMDINPRALYFCKKRGLKHLIKGSVLNIPFKNASFDIVLILDVLYHKQIEDDLVALKEINRVLKKGGKLLITDSACQALWGRHDIAVQARERYSKKELCQKLEKCGFVVKKASYFNTALFPFIFIVRKLDTIINRNKPAKSSLDPLPGFINKLLTYMFCTEIKIRNYIPLPFGVSIFCIAEKPKK